MRVRFTLLLFSLLLAAAPARSQRTGDVVERWREAQMQAVRGVESARCSEASNRRVEGPHGVKEIHTVSRLRITLRHPHVERDVERVEMNDRPVPERERRRMMRYLQHGRRDHNRDLDRVIDMLFWPVLFASELHAEGPLRPDPLAQGTLRLDLLGSREHPVERLTLWFAPRDARLVRSRLLARHRPDDPPLVMETVYHRVRGLDVPDTRRVEGTMLVRRRSRTFTMRYEQQIAYSDYHFER